MTGEFARSTISISMHLARIIVALLLVALVGCPAPNTPARSGETPDLDIPAPAFNMTERSGKPVTLDDLKGKVWVASFVFTRCSGPCPQVSAAMARLQKELNLKETADLRLVTFTVDPDRDTPNELREYANRYQAEPEKWLFLTGLPEAELHKLLKEGFKVTAQRSPSPKPGDEFDHSSRLAVVDKKGVIRGYFDGIRSPSSKDGDADFEENLKRLKEMVSRLLVD
jgi:protein SCO1/2